MGKKETLRCAELFAGVGGFRLGLEGWRGMSSSSGYTESWLSPFRTVWSNQYEPSTKRQHASLVYATRFGAEGHSNEDIETVRTEDIPDVDVLVGGFPCQDYSVASTSRNAKGIIGKKGVLWWSIYRILAEKTRKPSYLIFENVDRLLKSPSSLRGRDFAIILKSLDELGYALEWRVVNAADYGMPQRRRRVFMVGYHRDSSIYPRIAAMPPARWLAHEGVFAHAFPHRLSGALIDACVPLAESVEEISALPSSPKSYIDFQSCGLMREGQVYTRKSTPEYHGGFRFLGDVLQDDSSVPEEFYLPEDKVEKWTYLKGPKRFKRVNAEGYAYAYSEGGMVFPDPIDRPSRTIITSEGGNSPSRGKHVVSTERGLRRLTPLELERLNMFPDYHAELEGISPIKRAFLMGNALVVGVVERIGRALAEMVENG